MMKYVSLVCLVIVFGESCSFTQKVRTGMQAYEVKQYSVASQLFEKEYAESRSPQEKAQIAFYEGECYSRLNDPAEAALWYQKAYKDGYGVEAQDRYAGALKRQEKYEEAIQAYDELLKSSPGNASYRSNITLCRQAIEWKKDANPAYEIVSAVFNGTASDYSPQPIGPGMVLFTSDRDSKQSSENYLWTGRAFSDLYSYNSVSKQVTIFDDNINSPENEGTAVISPDGQMLVFTRCYVHSDYDAWCKLMISYRRGNAWSSPEPFTFVKEKINYGQPAFAANGSTLFFASDAPEGQGGHDIYFTQLEGENSWSEPVNLGSLINTSGDEQYPTVYLDTLYYSSDQLAGLGGLDIFKTYLNAQGQFVPPVNLRAPVNSGGDDFGFVVDTFAPPAPGVLMEGYFTSSRGGVSRNDDIYAFTLKGAAGFINLADIPEDEIPEKKPVEYQLFLALRVVEPEFEIRDDPNSKRIGQRALPNGPVIMTEGRTDQRFVTNESGYMLLQLDWDKPYIFSAKYRDHLTATYSLNTGDIKKSGENPIITINHTLELDPIFKNMEIILENILYDYDEWFIRDDAKPSLDHLAKILKSNPGIRIQLSSHTDCRGTDEYNIDLSQKRAQAAVDYLVSVGISSGRLTAQGFGESIPAVNCICENCTEEQHQINRRTTFKIID